MTLRGKWKSTTRPEGPTGYKRTGTFRDVSLRGAPPWAIDEIDAACIGLGITRHQVFRTLRKSMEWEAIEGLRSIFPEAVMRRVDDAMLRPAPGELNRFAPPRSRIVSLGEDGKIQLSRAAVMDDFMNIDECGRVRLSPTAFLDDDPATDLE